MQYLAFKHLINWYQYISHQKLHRKHLRKFKANVSKKFQKSTSNISSNTLSNIISTSLHLHVCKFHEYLKKKTNYLNNYYLNLFTSRCVINFSKSRINIKFYLALKVFENEHFRTTYHSTLVSSFQLIILREFRKKIRAWRNQTFYHTNRSIFSSVIFIYFLLSCFRKRHVFYFKAKNDYS